MLEKIVCGVSLTGALLVSGCAGSSQSPPATVTVTATSAPRVVTFDPTTSGKVMAARLTARAKPKTPGETITGAECRNFPDIKVGTHTDCQLRVNGVKKGYRVTFTTRDGHYVVASQALTW